MKETSQHYLMEVSNPNIVEIGQPIVDGDRVIGFISEIFFDGRANVMLFEPQTFEFKPHMENLSESVDNVLDEFATAMVKASSEVKDHWKELVEAQQKRNER